MKSREKNSKPILTFIIAIYYVRLLDFVKKIAYLEGN